ncbi:MAG TPA: N-acetylglucosamine-6-phosphate deacetylase [Candidatus Blautia avistercoris]|nr:N-acetylglucosamine-6-phosphate deacetylase [Candidatus Blautia avistercoris]
MIIKNGKVFQEDGNFVQKDLYIDDNHKIARSEEQIGDKSVVDAGGKLVIPGLVDIHSHGAFGHDFSDGDSEGLKIILKYQKDHGITSYCPTSMTLPKEQLLKIFQTVREVEDYREGARVAGINMEGPFIDPAKKGAHVEGYIVEPDVEFFRECNEKCGNRIKLVTLAPNTRGAERFIEELHRETCISLGHTGADYETCKKAMELGAHHVTHLFNAMLPFAHREPGLVGAAADDDSCMVELIGDGLHIHPGMVRSIFRMFGEERVCLISDSMMATGMENGTYELGGQKVQVKDRKATLKDGTIAGSATNLFDVMKTVHSFGIPLKTAVFAATRNPAKSIGIYETVGSVTPGKEADLLILSENLDLLQVI